MFVVLVVGRRGSWTRRQGRKRGVLLLLLLSYIWLVGVGGVPKAIYPNSVGRLGTVPPWF